jgi:glycosyltransferase involved in cell wall biosynthesis
MSSLISIIVPVYNVELYIEQCIESIISQTYMNIEIILVDDGSTDNSPFVCDEYAKKDSRIKVIHKSNGGLSSARNAGLKKALGDYIGFIDSDDYISPTMFQYLMNNMDENVGIVSCQIFTDSYGKIGIFRCGDSINAIKDIKADEYLRESLFLKASFVAWNKLYRKSFIDNIYFEEGRNNEDVLFLYEIGKRRLNDTRNIIREMPERLYYYRMREGSICNNLEKPLFVDRMKVFKKIYTDICNYNVNLAKSYLNFIIPFIFEIYFATSNKNNDEKYIETRQACLFFIRKSSIVGVFSNNKDVKFLIKHILFKYLGIKIHYFSISPKNLL